MCKANQDAENAFHGENIIPHILKYGVPPTTLNLIAILNDVGEVYGEQPLWLASQRGKAWNKRGLHLKYQVIFEFDREFVVSKFQHRRKGEEPSIICNDLEGGHPIRMLPLHTLSVHFSFDISP